jgi:hypothetical protein
MKNLHIIIVLLFGFRLIAQDENMRPVDSTEFVRIHVMIGGDQVFVRILQLPESSEFGYLIFNEVNEQCSGGLELNPAIIGKQHTLISLKNSCSESDTFVFIVQNRFENRMKYPPILFRPGQDHSELVFGEGCYKMSCIPQNDPWMPYVEEPFLISKKNYYLNPENGRIMSGKRIIRNGLFTACELESWIPIEEFGSYSDKNMKIYSGRELIAMKRLKMKEWDINAL